MADIFQNLFNRIMAFILAVIAALSGGVSEAPEMKVTNDVTTQTAIVQYEITNYTGNSYITFGSVTVERKVGDEWVKLEFSPYYKTNEVAFTISNRQTVPFKVDVINAFGDKETGEALPEGEYRISTELILSKDYSDVVKKVNEFEKANINNYETTQEYLVAKKAYSDSLIAQLKKEVCYAEFTVIAE